MSGLVDKYQIDSMLKMDGLRLQSAGLSNNEYERMNESMDVWNWVERVHSCFKSKC